MPDILLRPGTHPLKELIFAACLQIQASRYERKVVISLACLPHRWCVYIGKDLLGVLDEQTVKLWFSLPAAFDDKLLGCECKRLKIDDLNTAFLL